MRAIANLRGIFSWPLFAKELIEVAARRRTYVTRVVYAALLFGFFAMLTESMWERYEGVPMHVFGMGRQMFEVLVALQLFGIYLFLPALAAGQITQEKERDSLVLLLLTELSPWQILLQKYASSLLVILSFLLIGLPLAALAYAFGGISPLHLFTGVYALLLTCLQVAAFALFCSARARTTVAAFLGTYLGGGALFLALLLLGTYLENEDRGVYDGAIESCLSIFPALLLEGRAANWLEVIIASLPSLGVTVLCLLLARYYFIRRAFAPATNRLLGIFRRVDRLMERGNQKIGNIALRTRQRALPEDDPIAWREATRKSLGRPNYLVRILLAVEIPTLALCLLASAPTFGYSRENFGLSWLAAMVGTVSVLALGALGANAFVSERVNQTLEVLLTTPLSAIEIVRQKAQSLSRFMWVLAVPLATIFGIECWAEGLWLDVRWSSRSGHSPLVYLAGAALTLAIYLPLVLWLSLWIGLKMRTRFRAILTALGVIVGWCALPIILATLAGIDPNDPGSVLMLLSPIMFPAGNEMSFLKDFFLDSPIAALVLNFAFYLSALVWIRRRCLRKADLYLRG